jgi:hypothetical protein
MQDGGTARANTFKTEIPRIVAVKTGPRSWVLAEVFEKACAENHTGGRTIWPTREAPGRHYATVYLCGNKADEAHELAHVAGMKHTAWQHAGNISCATVILAGYGTGYKALDHICVRKDTRYEWVDQTQR